MPTLKAKPKRTKRLNLRTTPADKRLFETAASRQNTDVTDFVLESARARAEAVLADEQHFALPADQWKAFVAALDRPAQAKPRLRRLFAERSVLER